MLFHQRELIRTNLFSLHFRKEEISMKLNNNVGIYIYIYVVYSIGMEERIIVPYRMLVKRELKDYGIISDARLQYLISCKRCNDEKILSMHIKSTLIN